MIPAKITAEIFNNLKWEEIKATSIDKELEGYIILGAETITGFELPDGEDDLEGVVLYLQDPREDRIKIINIDDNIMFMDEEEVDSEDVIKVTVAYIEGEEADHGQRAS